jgi:hypothetical protein
MDQTTPPTADLFLHHLGKPVESIEAAVFRYAHKPNFELPEHSPIGGIFFKRLGLSITFCPPDFYHADAAQTGAPAIITNVQMYSGDDYYDHARYASSLPHALSFADSREDLQQKLGNSKWTFPFVAPFKLERWDFPGHWLLVSYTEDMSALRMIEVGLRPGPPIPSVLPKIEQPDIHTLQSLLELRWNEVAMHPSLQDADFSALAGAAPDDENPHEVDELLTRGIELYFRRSQKNDESFFILSGARYIRKGLYSSAGFDGALPKGLLFSDTPETVVGKVGSYPVTGKADELTGYYVWKLPEYMLHVGFSVMEQRVNRIRVAAHPYYAVELLESPLLKTPS